jgi:hypothetical protein
LTYLDAQLNFVYLIRATKMPLLIFDFVFIKDKSMFRFFDLFSWCDACFIRMHCLANEEKFIDVDVSKFLKFWR